MSEVSSDSESCPSYQTESESEHESTWGEEKEQKEVDYTSTAKEIICENVNITNENALKLNSGYHNMLKVLKNKLEILLSHCQERQCDIEKQILDYRTTKKPLVGKSRTSGYICGQPYFKDEDLYPGPHNEDYLHRKNVLREFFPLDLFEVTDTNWTVKDKVNILKGVKAQIIEFIEMENRLKIKKVGNGLEAERLRREIASLKGKEINDLWEKVKLFPKEYPGQKFEIDWMRISYVNISDRHSVEACIGIWNNYMLPGLMRDAWRPEEETRLLQAVNKHRRQDWHQIAQEVVGRSQYQCFVHYQTTFSDMAQIKHARWTTEEDAALVKAVEDNRVGTNIVWNKVVEKMPLRNKIQCYNRYMFTLMRPSKNAKFTPEEDCIITAYVQECGDDVFRFIPPNLVPGRTSRQIWARYNHTLKYVNKHAGWTIEEDMRLMNFIKENLTDEGPRKISWAACSKALGNHSRLSCRTRYYTIEKFLDKNPDATLDDVPRKEKRLSTKVTNENWMKTIIDIRNVPKQEVEEQEQPSTSAVSKKEKKALQRKSGKQVRHFSDKLKCVNKKRFYDKLKYSFHYRFGDRFPYVENERVFCNNRVILQLMSCTTEMERVNDYIELFTPNEATIVRRSLAIRLNPGLVNFLQSAKYCFLFPPSYNTFLGLRGVVLNANYPNITGENEKKTKIIKQEHTDEIGYQYALSIFRERFRMLFYWTLLASRQNPQEASFQNSENLVAMENNYQVTEIPEDSKMSIKTIEEQVSLEQLSKLHNSSRLPRIIPWTPELENPLAETTVCLDQLDLTESATKPESPPKIVTVKSLRKFRVPRRLSQLQPVPIEQLMHTSLVEQTPEPPSDIVSCEASSSCQAAVTDNFVVVAPYQQQYTELPQVQYYEPTSTSATDSMPVYSSVSYSVANSTYRSDECTEKPAEPMNFVGQITIINPEDLPAVPPPEADPVEVEMESRLPPEHEHDPVEEHEVNDDVVSGDRSEGDPHETDEEVPAADEPGHSDVEDIDDAIVEEPEKQLQQEVDQEPMAEDKGPTSPALASSNLIAELDDPTTNHALPSDEVTSEKAEIDLEIETLSLGPANLSHITNVTNVTNVGCFVIEELEETRCRSAELQLPGTPQNVQEETSITQLPEEPLNLHISSVISMSDAYSGMESSHELSDTSRAGSTSDVLVAVQFSASSSFSGEKEDSFSGEKEDSVCEPEALATTPSIQNQTECSFSAQSDSDSELDLEMQKGPQRTYSRTRISFSSQNDKQHESPKLTSHAWRWIHVDEAKQDDIEMHSELWEICDPMREQFRHMVHETAPKPEKITRIQDEIVVISDDEIEIKDEPLELEDDELPQETTPETETVEANSVDASYIQEIIQTASNILRISETYKIMNPTNNKTIVIEPLPPPPQSQPGRLIVQTPSRIFDEEANCYYYVDEVMEDTESDIGAPIVNIEQTSTDHPERSNLADIVQHSLQKTYPVMPQFGTSRRSATPMPRPQLQKEQSEPNSTTPPRTYINTFMNPMRRVSRSRLVESRLQEPQAVEPRISKPKRPPRERAKPPSEQRGIQVKALSLLDALYKRPRLVPNPSQRPSPTNSPSTSAGQRGTNPKISRRSTPSTPASIMAPPKRPRSTHAVAKEKIPKRRKEDDQIDNASPDLEYPAQNIKQEPGIAEMLENIDDTVDAVDIIDALNSMHQRVKLEGGNIADDDDEEEEQMQIASEQPCASTSTEIQLPCPVWIKEEPVPIQNTATQQKFQTIVQNSTARPDMNVHFKVGGITIKKVPHK